jgi:ribose/xylose/arabinose/galactoside ABC-type transport system permease subunit
MYIPILVLVIVFLWPAILGALLRVVFVKDNLKYILPLVCSLIWAIASIVLHADAVFGNLDELRNSNFPWLAHCILIGTILTGMTFSYFFGLFGVLLVDGSRRIVKKMRGE